MQVFLLYIAHILSRECIDKMYFYIFMYFIHVGVLRAYFQIKINNILKLFWLLEKKIYTSSVFLLYIICNLIFN